MRNFWLEADVDGRETNIGAGPRTKDGGMSVAIRMRDEGNSVPACKVVCNEFQGKLLVCVYDEDGKEVYSKITKR